MSWIEVKPMDAKVLFIADWIRGQHKFIELCRRHGISRKTGYKWVSRYQELGIEGLHDQSRKPYYSPRQAPYHIRKEIIGIREKHSSWGPRKIGQVLGKAHSDWDIPCHTTIYNILKQADLLSPRRRRRRVPVHLGPLSQVTQPNELWSVDFKGQFKTSDGIYCYPLTVMDHASRYLLGCNGFYGTRYNETRQAFEKLFRKYGLPDRIRSDNGIPFASASTGGLSRLSVWWVRLGIIPERIRPGKPQQNSRHERMHRTLKQDATKPPARNMRLQQELFDSFRAQYNDIRPHEALGLQVPASVYRSSERSFPSKIPDLTYPDNFKKSFVNHNGCVHFKGKYLYVGYLLRGEIVGLEEIDNGIWDVYFGPILLGETNEHTNEGMWLRHTPYCHPCL